MKRPGPWIALALAACGGEAVPADLDGSGADLAGAAPLDLTALADLSMPPLDLSLPLDLPAPPDQAMPADLALSPDLSPPPYPAGPYGSNVGDTIAPLAWEGYINPAANGIATNAPYGLLAMNDLRLSGNKFALLYAADFW